MKDNLTKEKSNESTRCPYFKKCGGCKYINLPYEEQLKIKRESVGIALKEITQSGKVRTDAIIGCDDPFYYRNKVHSVFSRNSGGKIIRGIYREDSHKVVDVKGCLLEDRQSDKIIEEVKRLLPSFKYKVYDEDDRTGWLRHVLVRSATKNGKKEYMLVLVTVSVVFPGKNNFIKAIRDKFPEITTIVQNVNDKRTSMILGERNIICYGKGFIEDELLGLKFRISPSSFYQINPAQTKKLYSKVIELASPGKDDIIIDAYCGTGTIGSCLAGPAKEVIGIEANSDAVKDAVFNAKQNNIKNIRFVNEDATKWMIRYREKQRSDEIEIKSPDILIMDPPRSGSTPEFINAASDLEIPRIVYVSCNPVTLARDLKLFLKKKYEVLSITPFDMFPWTEHVETVVLLSRRT